MTILIHQPSTGLSPCATYSHLLPVGACIQCVCFIFQTIWAIDVYRPEVGTPSKIVVEATIRLMDRKRYNICL